MKWLLGAVALCFLGCSLLLSLNPEGQACRLDAGDADGCLPDAGFRCEAGRCVRSAGSQSSVDGGTS